MKVPQCLHVTKTPTPTPTPVSERPYVLQPLTLVEQQGDRLELGNVRWGFEKPTADEKKSASFKNTTVNPTKIKSVYYVLNSTQPAGRAYHASLYFEMQPDAPVRAADGATDSGLVVSFETHLHEGERFHFSQGLTKTYQPLYKVTTWHDTVQRTTGAWQKHLVSVYPLKLSATQRRQLFDNTMEAALADRTGEYYNTVNNSCAANAMSLVNSVASPDQKFHEWRGGLRTPSTTYPGSTDVVLAQHGLIDNDGPQVILPSGTEVASGAMTRKAALSDGGTAMESCLQAARNVLPALPGCLLSGPLARIPGVAAWGGRIQRNMNSRYVSADSILAGTADPVSRS